METKHTRIEWVDMGKYICIMFVMLSHLESGSVVLDRFFNPFFLSMFFFLSGYVYKQPKSFREHFRKKVRTLLVPWFLFSVGSILLSCVTASVSMEEIGNRFIRCFLQIRGLEDENWFVAALFVTFLPFYFFIKWEKPVLTCILTFLLSVLSLWYCLNVPGEWFSWGRNALPWHLEYIFQAMVWMVLGYYFRSYGEEIFDRYNTLRNRVLLWALYLLAVYLPEYAQGGVVGIVMSHVTSLLGVLAVMSVCKVARSCRYIRFVGANTLTYFALHGWVYAAVELALKGLAGEFYAACLGHPLASSVLAVAVTLVVSLILIVPAEIINRWFPWVLGRKRVKNAV